MYVRERRKLLKRIWSENLKEKGYSKDLGVDGIIIIIIMFILKL